MALALLPFIATPATAQDQPGAAPQTREEVIAAERAEKVAELWPERQNGMVDLVNGLVERGLKEGLDSGRGANGFQIVLGGMRSAQGMSGGIGYRRSDLLRDQLGFRGTARGTPQGAYMVDADFDFQGLRTDRTFLRWYTRFEHSPEIDYFGPGNRSTDLNRTSYKYDDLASDFNASFEFVRGFRIGATGGYFQAHTGRSGEDGVPPIDEAYPPETLPGLADDTNYTRIGVFTYYDTRDSLTGPRSGGLLVARYREYWDVERKEFAFRQTEFEVQRFVPYFNRGRVFAVRGSVVLSFPKKDNAVPMYLQPTLGGSDELRGFVPYRFKDYHALSVSAEHRWHAFSASRHGVVRRRGQGRPAQARGRRLGPSLQRRHRLSGAGCARPSSAGLTSRDRLKVSGWSGPSATSSTRGSRSMSRTPLLCLAIVVLAGTIQVATQGPRFYPDDPLAHGAAAAAGGRAAAARPECPARNGEQQLRTRGSVIRPPGCSSAGREHARRSDGRRLVHEPPRGPPHDAGRVAARARPRPAAGHDGELASPRCQAVRGQSRPAGVRRQARPLHPPLRPVRLTRVLPPARKWWASQFFYALGYHVAENYIVRFERPRLMVDETGQAVSSAGKPRGSRPKTSTGFSTQCREGAGGTYRAVATRVPEGRGALLGPYQMWGTRSDDPNDTVPHEHRRDLRGMFVFAAWLNFADVRAVTTQDIITTIDDVPTDPALRGRPHQVARQRHVRRRRSWPGKATRPLLPSRGAIGQNIARPRPRDAGVDAGEALRTCRRSARSAAARSSPEAWTTAIRCRRSLNRLPDDTFWAARQVMAFTDEEIRAIVQTGQYSKPAEDWITATLIERRNRIGRTYFSRVLPLDRFRVGETRWRSTTWASRYGFVRATHLHDRPGTGSTTRSERAAGRDWAPGRDTAGAAQALAGASTSRPAFMRAPGHERHRVFCAGRPTARYRGHRPIMARQERRDAAVAAARRPARLRRPGPPAAGVVPDLRGNYNATRGSQYTAEEVFERLTVSEQTTFYGVTHALLHTSLTDARAAPHSGSPSIGVEAVIGSRASTTGRGGDQQFRIYVTLKPGTREVLDKCREFFADHENTVYHAGFPHSYRQSGKEPNSQISMSEDGLRADIDVDYRSSRSPQVALQRTPHRVQLRRAGRGQPEGSQHAMVGTGHVVAGHVRQAAGLPAQAGRPRQHRSRRSDPRLPFRPTGRPAPRPRSSKTQPRNFSPTGWSGTSTIRRSSSSHRKPMRA